MAEENKAYINQRLRDPFAGGVKPRGSKPDIIGGIAAIITVVIALGTCMLLFMDFQNYGGF